MEAAAGAVLGWVGLLSLLLVGVVVVTQRVCDGGRVVRRAEADRKAAQILRNAGSLGIKLANGQRVAVRSQLEPESVTYVISPVQDRWGGPNIFVYNNTGEYYGSLCITSKVDAPWEDILMTQLQLVTAGEKELWATGNFMYSGETAPRLPQRFRAPFRYLEEDSSTT